MALNEKQQKQFNIVCARIAGGESLRFICEDKDLPDRDTINRWLNADNDGALCGQYARAREEQADFYADEIIHIADDESLDANSRREGCRFSSRPPKTAGQRGPNMEGEQATTRRMN